MRNEKIERCRKRAFEIIEIGVPGDYVSQIYDFTGLFAIIINLVVSVMLTFGEIKAQYGILLTTIEAVTVAFFALDYVLRVWTAQYLRPDVSRKRAVLKYLGSFTGIVDMLSFLPYYLPIFFPTGSVAFRMFRVMRIFRLFRINA